MNNIESKKIQIFLSIVIIQEENDSKYLDKLLFLISNILNEKVYDYEIIIVDNNINSDKKNYSNLTSKDGLPNLQIFSLSNKVSKDVARWVGIENSLGDYLISVDPRTFNKISLEKMIDSLQYSKDITFIKEIIFNQRYSVNYFIYFLFEKVFNIILGININSYSKNFIILSRRMITHLMEYPEPELKLNNLALISGFSKNFITIKVNSQNLNNNIFENMRTYKNLATSFTASPLRIAALISLLGAIFNLFYSIYILLVVFLKSEIREGWISLSLQMTFMFFLFSIVLLILSEYVSSISLRSFSGPKYFIEKEYTSAIFSNRNKQNITS